MMPRFGSLALGLVLLVMACSGKSVSTRTTAKEGGNGGARGGSVGTGSGATGGRGGSPGVGEVGGSQGVGGRSGGAGGVAEGGRGGARGGRAGVGGLPDSGEGGDGGAFGGAAGEGDPGCTVVDDLTARVPFTPCVGPSCTTLDQAVAQLTEVWCPFATPFEFPRASSGCGFVVLTHGDQISGGSSIYDAATRELVGYTSYSDFPWGPCRRYQYIAGASFPSCEGGVRTCSLCDNLAGEGGAAGQAGATGASSCPDSILE